MSVDHPEDIRKLKEHIPALCVLQDKEVERLYRQWSEYNYAAGWMMLDEDTLQQFKDQYDFVGSPLEAK